MIIIWPRTEEEKKAVEKQTGNLLHPTDDDIRKLTHAPFTQEISAREAQVMMPEREEDVMRGIGYTINAGFLENKFPKVTPRNSLTIAGTRQNIKTGTYLTIFGENGEPIFDLEERRDAMLCGVVVTKKHGLIYRLEEITSRLKPQNNYGGKVLWVANPTLEIENITELLGIDKKSGKKRQEYIQVTDLERVIAQAGPYKPAR